MARTVLSHRGAIRLSVAVRHAMGTLDIDVNFEVTQPWTILFGPSGSGKSTILRAIAGLVRPQSAKIIAVSLDPDGRELSTTMTDTQAGCFVPCHLRCAPLAAQRTVLFPHRSVRQQIVYGMGADLAGETREEKAREMLDLFRIAPLADKLPSALSGGEAQRVHLARTAAAASTLLLLDEPFNGLDLALRSEIMNDLKAWAAQKELCVLSVTHDVAEAFQLDAEVIKLAEGRVVKQGAVATVLAQERAWLLEQLSPAE